MRILHVPEADRFALVEVRPQIVLVWHCFCLLLSSLFSTGIIVHEVMLGLPSLVRADASLFQLLRKRGEILAGILMLLYFVARGSRVALLDTLARLFLALHA